MRLLLSSALLVLSVALPVQAQPALQSASQAAPLEVQAWQTTQGVRLQWSSDGGIFGFNVYRQSARGRVKLNPQLIAGAVFLGNQASQSGFVYRWLDAKQVSGARYVVEAIGFSGTRTSSAPIAAVETSVQSGTWPLSRLVTQIGRRSSSGVGVRDVTAASLVEMPRSLTTIPTGNLTLQWYLAQRPTIKIRVTRTGWMRLSQAQLVAAGMDANAAPASIKVYAEGQAVPVSAPRQKSRLEAGDFIEFFAQALDAPTTGTRTYWLDWGGANSTALPARTPTPPAAQVRRDYYCAIQDKPRELYFSTLENGDADNYFGPVIVSDPLVRTLPVVNPRPAVPGRDVALLDVAVQGLTSADHVVGVTVNGTSVGSLTFSGRILGTTRLNVPTAILRAGGNDVSLSATGGDSDVNLLDSLRLIYPRLLRAVNNNLTFVATGGTTLRVDGFNVKPARLLDVSNPLAPYEIPTQFLNGGFTVRIPGSGNHTLQTFAGTPTETGATLEHNAPSNWHLATNSGDEIMFSPAAFTSALTPLVTRRTSEGLTVRVVDIEDVYDEFSYGAHTPQAVRDFLAQAKRYWKTKPRFVLLNGDASYDPRGYEGAGHPDFIPTKLLDIGGAESPSDDWLADLNSDGAADIPIGRLPVDSAAEANLVVGKIAGYDASAAGAQDHKVLLVSDTLRGYDFEGANLRVSAVLPPELPTQVINRSSGDALSHQQLMAAWNESPLLVNYFGHGSVDIWTGGGLLNNADAANLTNTQPLPVVLSMTCLTGYFTAPGLPSLAESLVKAPQGGAVAIWASSGETLPIDQEKADKIVLQTLFPTDSSAPPTLGEAIVLAKSGISDQDIRQTWTLFGDPAMHVARPAPAAAPPASPVVVKAATRKAVPAATPQSPGADPADAVLKALVRAFFGDVLPADEDSSGEPDAPQTR